MSTDWRTGLGKFAIAITFSSVTVPCWESMVSAQQIIPDETLGAESSVVTTDNIKGLESDRISGGAIRGSNLFHSFRSFNIGEGRGGYFENPAAIENIFSRVTGSNPSEILGTLGVLGNANLFFLNPNGIIFGQNASLDLRGSFVGTTADSIVFPDGNEFSATNPGVPPLLTVNVQQPIGLQFEGESGIITNAADLAVVSRQTSNENETNLAVNPGQTLALIGGNVTIDGAEIISPGSNIEIGGLKEAGIVNINPDLSLSFPQGIKRGDVSLINSTVLDVAGNDGGSININAQNIDINDSQLLAGIGGGLGFENAQAGDIRLDVTETLEVENSFILNDVNLNALGNSGRILVNAQDFVINDSVIATDIGGRGNSGGILIDTATLSLTNGGEISASTFGEGDAGAVQVKASEGITLDGETSNAIPSSILSQVESGAVGKSGGIIIDTSTLSLTKGGQISASTFGEGDAGALQVTASGGITLDGETSNGLPSSILSAVESGAVGNSGGILINTSTLSLTNGAEIFASTFGQGEAGVVQITASEGITLDGEASDGFPTRILSQVESGALGKRGRILINTSTLSLTNGGIISATTFGEGDAGAVQVTASERINIDGERSNGFPSSILSQVEIDAVGKSEGIVINTSTLSLTNGGQISTITVGEGDAGAVRVTASEGITLDGETSNGVPTRILSQVNPGAVGKSGEIVIDTSSLSLTNGAGISASTFNKGDAGAVRVTVSEGITLDGETSNGVPSRILSGVASDAMGKSGEIVIDTSSLSLTNGAQINASTFGEGDAGAIQVTASEGITLDGEKSNGVPSGILTVVGLDAVGNSREIVIDTSTLSLTNGGQISASTFGEGDAGDVQITASEGITLDGETSGGSPSRIVSQVNSDAVGNSGGILIDTSTLFLTNGGEISASTFGQGDAGLVQITATEGITLDGERSNGLPSVIFSRVDIDAVGDSGGILIDTSTLSLTNGGEISASTFGKGNAGLVQITATEGITLEGERSDGFPSRIRSQVESGAEGKSDGILMDTSTLSLTNGGEISASTFGEGDAGDVQITASDSFSLAGTSFDEDLNRDIGGILAFTLTTGKAGDITIDTPKLTISEGSGIEAFTQGEGKAGDITIQATESIILNTDTKLIVESSNAGKAGNITITTPLLTIGENAQLSATATETSTSSTAGDITLNVSFLNIAGELGIFAETKSIADAGSLAIQPLDTANLNINFSEEGFISARTTSIGDGGSITITAPETIDIRGNGSITAETSGSGTAGDITITTQQLNVSNQTEISASTSGTGSAGSITVLGTDSVFLDNSSISTTVNSGAIVDAAAASNIEIQTSWFSLTNNAQVSASTAGVGNAGEINLEAMETLSIDQSSVSSAVATGGIGDAGNVNLTAPSISVTDGSIISTATNGEGNAGEVNIIANEDILLSNSNASSAIQSKGIGTAGTVEVKAPQITLSGGSVLSSSTAGQGDAGRINITTEDLNLSNQTEISASTFSSGQAANINITANNFNLEEGATVITNTANSGQAGDIQLQIRDNLNLVNSTITASTAPNSTGKGGSINIDPQTVTLTNSQIAVNSQGQGTGGDITMQADALTLAEQSAITAETLSTDGGNIGIALGENLILRDKSQISASAGTAQSGGDGGNITIDASFIIAFPQEDSDITANAFEGDGGNITINANGILGIEFRDQQTPLSDITASSEFGQQGEVEINTSGIDPTRGLSNLPQETVEVEVAQGCQTTGGQSTLEFFAIGRGGLPPSPDELFSSEIVIAEWIPLDFEEEPTLDAIFSEAEFTTTTLLKLPCHRR